MIGTASTHQIYVLIECPLPWAAQDLESKHLPDNLKALAQDVKESGRNVHFLLIADQDTRPNAASRRVLIFEQQLGGYSKCEIRLSHLDQAADWIEHYLAGQALPIGTEQTAARDILICTHGSHDKCCARYGYPFYRQVEAATRALQHPVQIWQVSHIGGHRFAPTLIDFPTGRYYGGLDLNAFLTILRAQGDLNCFKRVYRGLGTLPRPAQILEQTLLLQQGWDWLHCRVEAQILKMEAESSWVELICHQPDGEMAVYHAVIQESNAHYLPGSCGSEKVSRFVKYQVESLMLVTRPTLRATEVLQG